MPSIDVGTAALGCRGAQLRCEPLPVLRRWLNGRTLRRLRSDFLLHTFDCVIIYTCQPTSLSTTTSSNRHAGLVSTRQKKRLSLRPWMNTSGAASNCVYWIYLGRSSLILPTTTRPNAIGGVHDCPG